MLSLIWDTRSKYVETVCLAQESLLLFLSFVLFRSDILFYVKNCLSFFLYNSMSKPSYNWPENQNWFISLLHFSLFYVIVQTMLCNCVSDFANNFCIHPEDVDVNIVFIVVFRWKAAKMEGARQGNRTHGGGCDTTPLTPHDEGI